MTITIPSHFHQPSFANDIVYNIDGNTVVLLNRKTETERSKINITQHLIAFGIEGEKYFHSLDDDTVLHKNEAIFLKKGLVLTTEKIAESNSYKSILFFIDDSYLLHFFNKNRKYFAHLNSKESPRSYFKFENSSNLEAYINTLLPYFESENLLIEPLFKVKLEELLLNLVLNDKQHSFKNFLINLNKKNDYNLHEFMSNNFTRNLRVEDFAYLNGMSVSSFKRNFEKVFNVTPAKWVKEKRLKKAEFILQTSDKNVNEVAMEVGFENPSHFIQVFKSYYGITPKKFQEEFITQAY
ncbi:AraC family transcriptional regulator [Arenibacter sp. GZD96]|uniref:helix-turn-helix transcriptional regulator n=1 Tax=Aurantibrevibacter litoralis TaxID=3106030 RepID=UPI002AFE66E5|nr:AraC family transcriptional regulator [Arenibacter sp. GZD-96]MEA1787743.1 AraC family transcriptional regulator [Arenibacter sp. GZD-96]